MYCMYLHDHSLGTRRFCRVALDSALAFFAKPFLRMIFPKKIVCCRSLNFLCRSNYFRFDSTIFYDHVKFSEKKSNLVNSCFYTMAECENWLNINVYREDLISQCNLLHRVDFAIFLVTVSFHI